MVQISRKWCRKQMAWMRRAAKGRVTVKQACAGPETGFAARYFPKVAGTYVSFPDRPTDGYSDADAARAAGIRYKHECQLELRLVSQRGNKL